MTTRCEQWTYTDKRPGFGNDPCRIESGEDSDDLPEAGCEVADTSSAPAPPQIRSPWPFVRSSSFVAAEQAVLVLVGEGECEFRFTAPQSRRTMWAVAQAM